MPFLKNHRWLVCTLLFFLSTIFVAVSTYQIFPLCLSLYKEKAFSNGSARQVPEICPCSSSLPLQLFHSSCRHLKTLIYVLFPFLSSASSERKVGFLGPLFSPVLATPRSITDQWFVQGLVSKCLLTDSITTFPFPIKIPTFSKLLTNPCWRV